MYVCRCEHGVLHNCCGEGDLELYSGKLDVSVEGWESAPRLSLREAARLQNPHNVFTSSTCNCKSGCTGKKCTCRQKRAPCSSKCHHGTVCKNTLLEQKENHIKEGTKRKEPTICDYSPKRMKMGSAAVLDVSNELSKQSWIVDLRLNMEDKEVLDSGAWLSDKHIVAAQQLLHMQFPKIQSLQLPYLEQRDLFKVMPYNGVQILNVNGNHWICVSTLSALSNTIDIYDSLRTKSLSLNTIKQCSLLIKTKQKNIKLRRMQVQQQSGGSDCGLFAIANATELCFGMQPNEALYDQTKMRKHLLNCFLSHKLVPFPKQKNKTRMEGGAVEIMEIKVYCVCRLPEDRLQKMARCQSCLEWFHQNCVQIPADVFNKKKTAFICQKCKHH